MNQVTHGLEQIYNFFGAPIMTLGNTPLSLWSILQFAILVVLLFMAASRLQNWLVNRLLTRSRLDTGARQAIGSITRYLFLFLGLLVILQTVGINLTTLNVLAGAVGIGIGFGLQNVASNFISGLIILFERPIKIGDRIEVGPIEGDVVEIGARSTKILTNDNITVIVPNSKFITENVINWMYNDPTVRFRVPVSVAYGSDLQLVERLLLEVARANPDVLSEPAPVVRFVGFGDDALKFELRPWSTTLVHRKGKLFSSLNFAIYQAFQAHGIEIPFPQRDLHIRSGALSSKLAADKPTADNPATDRPIANLASRDEVASGT
jgi:small-conductance mechanosensitive channel